jgi:hypothetical protein
MFAFFIFVGGNRQLKALRSRSFAFVGSEEKLKFQVKSTFMQRKQPISVCLMFILKVKITCNNEHR